jgi:hypothetical protein
VRLHPVGNAIVTARDCLMGSCSKDEAALAAVPFLGGFGRLGGVALGEAEASTGNLGQAARAFWSGPGARTAAEAWAKANGAVTLEMSAIGREAEELTNSLPWEQARPIWEKASQEFAATAAGEIHVFQGNVVRLESIWAKIEYQAWRVNSDVTRIIYHHVMEDGSVVVVP